MAHLHRASIITLLFVCCAQTTAEELICRYWADNRAHGLLPVGTNLEGKYHYAPDRQVDVLHTKLDVTPDFEERTVTGTASIVAQPIATAVEILRLDATDLNVTQVRCDGAEVTDFISTRTDLQIAFAKPIEVGAEFTIHIDYSAEPTKGLYFRTPEMGYPSTDTHIWTQGEAHEARHWFPCFDYPNEWASTEVICHVPKGMTVLSNGKRMGEDIDANGLKVIRWLQEKPHVNYLVCLVAGYLVKLEKSHREVPLGFYTQPTLADYAHNSFADTPDIMSFFEEEIGIPFPWNKYDQVTIRDFTAGGMENTTLTTLTHNTIFSEDTENLRTTRQLDAHEMAHQWFGDYVTCKDWSHVWLNEGFATYYAHLYEGHKFGPDAMLYGLARDARRIRRQKNDRKPIVYNQYKNPMEQFDYRSYPKGCWVLHMLRCQLGPDLYRKCIWAYLKKHALSSVVSEDLRQVIEQHSGRSMDRFFDQWLYHPRYPDLKITYKWVAKNSLAKVTIRQTQEVDDAVMLFEFPTKLRFVVDGMTIDHEIVVKETEEDFYVPLSGKPSIVRFDPEYTVLADVSFDKSDNLFKAQLENADDMMGRLLAVYALGDRKTHASVAQLKKTLNGDSFFGVRNAAATSLAKHDTEEARAALVESWKQQSDARVRSVVVERIVNRFSERTLKHINEIITKEKNPSIKATAIAALGRYHGESSRRQITGYLSSASFRNELALAAISAIRQQNDPAYKQPLMAVLNKDEDRFTSRGFGQGLGALGHVAKSIEKKDDVRDFLVKYVNHPKTIVRTSAIDALGNLGDPKAISVLGAFSDSNDERVSRAANQALRKLRESKPTVPRELIELRKQIAEMQKADKQLEAELKEIREQLNAKSDLTETNDDKS